MAASQPEKPGDKAGCLLNLEAFPGKGDFRNRSLQPLILQKQTLRPEK